jgi:hypothetical protein
MSSCIEANFGHVIRLTKFILGRKFGVIVPDNIVVRSDATFFPTSIISVTVLVNDGNNRSNPNRLDSEIVNITVDIYVFDVNHIQDYEDGRRYFESLVSKDYARISNSIF